jgi:SnoaL-like domain
MGSDSDVATQADFELLERRVRDLQDRLDLYQLTSAYGPAVDADLIKDVTDLWADDGTYDLLPMGRWTGRAELRRLFESERHHQHIANGCAHIASLPHVSVDGDHAVTVGYQELVEWDRSGGEFQIIHVVASRSEWMRTTEGWKLLCRVNRVLDGTTPGRDLLHT